MTVVASLISKNFTAHASDSLLTQLLVDGTLFPKEWKKSKIIPVQKWHGAFAYWGLAIYDEYNWSTYDFLQSKAGEAKNYDSPEDFGQAVSIDLNKHIFGMNFANRTYAGIGIHFSAYEYLENYWIPELFLISNWGDTSYNSIRPEGFGLTRETFHTISGEEPIPEHRNYECRKIVQDRINKGVILRYNNGDPLLFNIAADSIISMFVELLDRDVLDRSDQWETYASIAKLPIQIVSNVQHSFCKPGTRLVGGRIHDLAITPHGEFFSTSGDY